MTDSIPRHTYETVDGTDARQHAIHEPRTLVHTQTIADVPEVINMMTEIGDGVFVCWTHCRTCNRAVAECKCAAGPTEPHYMKPWRDKRFERSLRERPDPNYDLLPQVIEWARERGYTVTKKGEKKPTEKPVEAPEPVEMPVNEAPAEAPEAAPPAEDRLARLQEDTSDVGF